MRGRDKVPTRRFARHSEWRLAALTGLLVVIPTAALIVVMSFAWQNEQLAARQRLTDAYRLILENLADDVAESLRHRMEKVERRRHQQDSAALLFHDVVAAGEADSVIVFGADNQPIYPGVTNLGIPPEFPESLQEAAQVEADGDYVKAAALYAEVADEVTQGQERFVAWQGLMRARLRSGQIREAIRQQEAWRSGKEGGSARDGQGRLILPQIDLMVLQHIATTDPSHATYCQQLSGLLRDYVHVDMPSSQRRFLMSEVMRICPGEVFETYAAEQLAEDWLTTQADHLELSALGASAELQPSTIPRIWHVSLVDQRIVLIFREETIRSWLSLTAPFSSNLPPPNVAILAPQEHALQTGMVSSGPLAALPGWRVVVSLPRDEAMGEFARSRAALYGWCGVLLVAVVMSLGLMLTRALRHALSLAELKNDLVGTVSHELRTPLASMRVLVDTLLEGDSIDPQQAREYLTLIAQENQRLSTLVDRFLSFSRWAQHATPQREWLDLAQVIQETLSITQQRLPHRIWECNVDVAEGMPAIHADRDGMMTVLFNLLDNAIKYSSPEIPKIEVKAWQKRHEMVVSVTDSGIGMSPLIVSRIFRPFYQAERRLAHPAKGCGLGLSIVQGIVTAHHGRVEVASVPGQGTTVTVSLPLGMSQVTERS